MTIKEDSRELTLRQRKGRAINAVAELLRRKLSVPNIYLGPPSSLISADILAVDRGGAGDLHAVAIKLQSDLAAGEGQWRKPSMASDINQLNKTWSTKFSGNIQAIHRQLMSMPSHFRYLAIPAESYDRVSADLGSLGLWPKDGIGRLGVITIRDRGEETPAAEIAVVPERFRMDSAKLKAIETRLLDKSRPDIEVRI